MATLRLKSLLGLGIFAAMATAAQATDFAAPKTYPVGLNPIAIITGDFNGDGKIDIAVANSGSGTVSILLGNGNGTFQPAVDSPAGASPVALALGDFNGDQKLDLIVLDGAGTGTSATLQLLLGKGDGTFQGPVPLSAGIPRSVAVADLNGDQKLDLIVGNDSALTILLGKGDGTFQTGTTVPLTFEGPTSELVAGDFNGDQKIDIATVVSKTLLVLLGKGDGTFGAPFSTAAGASAHLAAVDADGDGKLDLLVRMEIPRSPTCRRFCFAFDRFEFFHGNGDGTFAAAASAIGNLFGNSAGNLVSADLNSDGKPDMIYPRSGNTTLSLARGDGTFLTVGAVANSLGPFVVTADVNGDKLADLIVTDPANGAIVVILNNSPASGADMAVTESPATANITIGGDDLLYEVSVLNEGPTNATGVSVKETLPASWQLVSATPSQGSCSGTTVVTCDLGAMTEPSLASIQFDVKVTQPGTFSDAVQVSANEADLNTKNNAASITVTAVLPADIGVSASASKTTAATGDKIMYTVQVTNKGPAVATNVVLADQISDPALAVSGLVTGQGTCTPTSGTINCIIGTMAVGSTVTVTFAITAGPSESLDNQFTVAADQPDLNSGDNAAEVTVLVNPANIGVSQAASATSVTEGTQVTYTITIGNKGPAQATNVMVNDNVPPTSTISAVQVTQGSCTAVVNGVLTCSLGALAPSAKATVTFGATSTAVGTMTNGASVSATEPDPDPSDNSSSLDVNVTDFTISASAPSLTVQHGGQASATVTLTAQGGFSGTINLACSVTGPAPTPSCGIAPLSLNGGGSATLTINAAALAQTIPATPFGGLQTTYAVCLPLGMIGCLAGWSLDKKRRKMWTLVLLLLTASIFPVACGGGSSRAPENFTVTVTASSGASSHTTTIPLTVN